MASETDPAIVAAPVMDLALTQALIAEIAAKADLVWVQVGDHPAQALWHIWHDGAVTVVTGGREQPDPGFVAGQTVQLILRSKDKLTRVLTISADVVRIEPDSAEWDDVSKALHPKRLNASDGEEQPRRWARESAIWQLRPTGLPSETPGAMNDASDRAVPRATPATTDDWRPFHAGKATRRRR